MAVATTYIGNATDDTNLTTYTFSSQSIGSASADRIVVVGIASRNTSASTVINSVTIGGNTASIDVQDSNSTSNYNICGIASLLVTSGTTADIVVTFSGAQLRAGIAIYTVTGANETPYATNSDNSGGDPSLDLNVPANGGAIGVAMSANTSLESWTGITEDSSFFLEAVVRMSSAHDDFGTAQTPLSVTCDFVTPLNAVGCSISYDVASVGGFQAAWARNANSIIGTTT
jgi:hypothetical protein